MHLTATFYPQGFLRTNAAPRICPDTLQHTSTHCNTLHSILPAKMQEFLENQRSAKDATHQTVPKPPAKNAQRNSAVSDSSMSDRMASVSDYDFDEGLCCSILAWSSVMCVAVRCSALQCVAVCCSVLQCVTVCCSVLLNSCVNKRLLNLIDVRLL